MDEDAKAILLAQALDAIRAGLQAPGLEHRLRAASMAVSILGTKPSRNPMAPAPRPTGPAPGAARPAWMPAPGTGQARGSGTGAADAARREDRARAGGGGDDLGLDAVDDSPF